MGSRGWRWLPLAGIGETRGGDVAAPASKFASLGAFGRGLSGGKDGGGRGLLIATNDAQIGGVNRPNQRE